MNSVLSELIRLGPFHLTFVAPKDVREPSISNFYRLAPVIESHDHQQATEPPEALEEPSGSDEGRMQLRRA